MMSQSMPRAMEARMDLELPQLDLKGLAAALPKFGAKGAAVRAKADAAVVNLLARTTFGYTEDELALASGAGFDAWLEYQLDHEAIDDGGLEEILTEFFPTLAMDYNGLFRAGRGDSDGPTAAFELIYATVLRQAFSPRQLYEVMVEFWTNHFNVFLFDGPVQYFKTVDDRDHIRPHALGTFGDLLHANASSPAMLSYLDNYSNTAEGPNENYARELLELHTLGVDGGYTEFDVKETARCFTGWTLTTRVPGLFYFDPLSHDFGGKSVLGTDIAPNRGIEDGRQVLNLLADHPSTATYIAGKLARRFISDQPPAAAVTAVAETFRETGGDIRSMLRTLFRTEAFAASAGQKFKRPAEFVTSMLRRINPEAGGDFLGVLVRQLQVMGQLPYFETQPTGYDDVEGSWLSTSSLLGRWNLASAVGFGTPPAFAADGRGRVPPMAQFLPVDIAAMVGGADQPAAIVDALVERVLHHPVSSEEWVALVKLAAGGRKPGMRLSPREVDAAARSVLAAIMGSRHFLRR
ncbi:MAG: DUF1800 domain-containing protein [Pseudomonadota bacterium]